jgi:tetratricopeptide (TPR) repeat protein
MSANLLCEAGAQSATPINAAADLLQRSSSLERQGRVEQTGNADFELLRRDPAHKGALNRLGNMLFAAGKIIEAQRVLSLAVGHHPGDPMSRVNLANVLIKNGDLQSARAHLQHALGIDPEFRPAHAGLSFVLRDLGQHEEAALHRRRAFQGNCVVPVPYLGTEPPVTVLELISTHGGNVRTRLFLSDRVFRRYLVAAEFYDSTTVLPPHQLIVNAIGDADLAEAALRGAAALVARASAPMINPPAAVLATGRCAIAARLGAIPGVITAKTANLSRELLTSDNAEAALRGQGFRFPLLVRTPGFHGGENFVRVETPDALAGAVAELPRAQRAGAELPGDELTVIEYLDARAADGKTRKYRVMMIDGALYPLHAAISHHWKIHYYSAEMTESAENRAEDAAFLADMESVLGEKATNALREIQRTLGLDYAGIDFSLNAQGEVLVFEANATMAFFAPDPDPRWDYRRPAVENICRAIRKMLTERAGAAPMAVA